MDCVILPEASMEVKSKICSKCQKRKLVKYFIKEPRNTIQKIGSICKKCKSIYGKEHRKTYVDNRDRTEYRKKYYAKNKNKFKEWNKIWRKNNDRSEYYKEYRDKNPSAKVACYCRNRIRLAIKNGWKAEDSLTLTGCKSWHEVKIYLESKFQEGMSWENMGAWHIDHILPCSSFDLTDPEQQKKCFHYTNLQPLWATENLSKSDKI